MKSRLRRFAAVGVVVTLLDLAVVLGLRLGPGLPVVIADAAAVSMAAVASYVLHRRFTFASDPHVRWVREPATFAWITALAGAVDIAILRIAVAVVGSDDAVPLLVGKAIALAGSGVIRYRAYRGHLVRRVRVEQGRRVARPVPPGAVRLSVVVPAFNEEARIGSTVAALRSALASVAADGGLEVLVVDDGSSDATAAAARAGGADEVIVRDENEGKGAAVRAGMVAAGGRARAFIDADLAYPPDQLLRLLTEVEAGWDVVVGSRKHVETVTLARARRIREITGRLFNSLTQAVVLGHYRDTQCGLKAFRGDVADLVFSRALINGFAFDVEVFHLAERWQLSLTEVPVSVVNTQSSTVRIGLDAVRMVRDLFRIRRWAGQGRYELSPAEEQVIARS